MQNFSQIYQFEYSSLNIENLGSPPSWSIIIVIIIIIHEFHRDASLETKLQGRYVSRITLQL